MMGKNARTRDVIGVTLVFLGLLVLTIFFMLGEHFLDNFKAH